MFAGLDFGTSNCEIGVWQNNSPKILTLEGDKSSIPSTMYAGSADIDADEIDPVELQGRLRDAQQRHAEAAQQAHHAGVPFEILKPEQLKAVVLGLMRREQAQNEMRAEQATSLAEALAAGDRALFGEQAVAQHSLAPEEGFFVKSPKSFLGTELRIEQIETYSEVVTKMMANIKALAERQVEAPLTQVVIGRPVNFHSSDTSKGNAQAVGILERAAVAAGYDHVSFMFEPVAAALDYERNIDTDQKVLVLDFGGGTTDCSMVMVGPSYRDSIDRNLSILSYTGDRVGGNDLDMKLAFHTLMPDLGSKSLLKSGLSVPSALFWDSVATNDIPAQTRFRSAATARSIDQLMLDCLQPELLGRMKTLQNKRLSYRINRSAELAKIQLSNQLKMDVPLDYIEDSMSVAVTRDQFSQAIERELDTCRKLIVEAERQAGEKPDVIYVTGGTAKSPIIEAFITSLYSGREIIVGDHFGSVASGLTAYASRKYA